MWSVIDLFQKGFEGCIAGSLQKIFEGKILIKFHQEVL